MITLAEAAVMLCELSAEIARTTARHKASHQFFGPGQCPCRAHFDSLKSSFRAWYGAMGAATVAGEPETCEADYACARYKIWGLERYVAYALDEAAPGGDAAARGRACAAHYPTSELRIDIAALADAQRRFEAHGHSACGAPEKASASHGWPEW